VIAFFSRKLNQTVFVFVEQNSVHRSIFGITFTYLNARQATAAYEGIRPNVGDVVANRYACQATAVFEGPIRNTGDAVGDSNACQTTAAREGSLPNNGDRFSLIGGGNH
jgi:hypothetical protein